MLHFVIKMIVKLRDLNAAFIAFLIRPILHDMLYKLNRLNQLNLSTAALHQKTFLPFKGINKGKDVVVVACGPSAKDYATIHDAIHIGINRAYKLEDVSLDYYFCFDFSAFNSNPIARHEINEYRKNNCVKFYGLTNEMSENKSWTSSDSDQLEAQAFRFRADGIVPYGPCESEFHYDISTMPLADFRSIVFSAIQFALWTNPRRIFLVGCDCTASGHFNSTGDLTGLPNTSKMRDIYSKLRQFASAYYPDTEIISVNPVGLKGIFRDWYQKDGPLEQQP